MNEECLGCEWYNKPYWSIISPCTNCSKRFKEKPIKVMKYSINIDKSDLYEQIEKLQQENEQLKEEYNLMYDRLVSESTEWESKYYELRERINKAIEKVDILRKAYERNISPIPCTEIERIDEVLKGENNE